MRYWVLYVEDSEDDVRLVRETLPAAEFPLTWAPTAAAARKHLETMRFDLILLDHGLPDSNGLALLDEVHRLYPELPVVFFTGREDEALAASARKKGATDYILKEEVLERLAGVVRRIVAASGDKGQGRTARPETAPPRALDLPARTDRIYRVVLESMNEGCLLVDLHGIVTFASVPLGRMLGLPAVELLGRAAAELFDDATRVNFLAFHRAAAAATTPLSERFEGRLAAPAGSQDRSGAPVLVSGRSVRDEAGEHEACLLVLSDISELINGRDRLRARLAELERFQRFFVDRERRMLELKARLRLAERRLGIEEPALSEETRLELERREDESRQEV